MSEEVLSSEIDEKEFTITVKISASNLSYKSDFSEPETVFWLESIKSIIINRAFDQVNGNS
jgi:hypothetical protein